MYTTNRYTYAGTGYAGVRIVLGSRTAVFEETTYYDVPCTSQSAVPVTWNDSYGESNGLDRDWDHGDNGTLWASIKESTSSDGCDGVSGCIGVGKVVVASANVTRYIHPSWDETNPAVPDVVGHSPDVSVIDKRGDGGVYQWDAVDGDEEHQTTGVDHASQMDWLDGSYYVATETETSTGCTTGTNRGSLKLLRLDGDAEVAGALFTHVTGDNSNKVEGLDAVPIQGGLSNDTCKTGGVLTADYVVYAVDFCNDRVHVLTVDIDAPAVAEKSGIAIDGDGWGVPCKPSSVRYDTDQDVVVVVCQRRGTILHFHVADDDQCSLTADEDSQVPLKYLITDYEVPDCEDTTYPTETNCSIYCDAHNIDYDYGVVDHWLFVALTTQNQVTAVRSDNYNFQAVFYRGSGTFEPMDLVVVED